MGGVRRRFRFIKEIAEGGFGKVYLAEQLSSDGFSRIVAVKLLHAKWSSHDEVVMRTRDEARLLGLIRHQHIVKVEDLTSIDGKCAIVMEYLEGVDLKYMLQFLRENGDLFPRKTLFEIILAVASALDAAYNGTPLQGGDPLRVIHRDIKPSNVFVTIAGGVKVLDFGTARANFAEREAKTQALAFGSQGYMAPERMLGEEDTPAADIFSLGITLYELLTGESFGRIPPRPSKFVKKMEDRIKSIPLEGEEEWCAQVRETLRLMTSYEPGERPTAAQLVDIFEILGQNAQDKMGLRRFCRTLVAEAKAREPELDTGDPLSGRMVEEDASSAFNEAGQGGAMTPLAPAGEPTFEDFAPVRDPADGQGLGNEPALGDFPIGGPGSPTSDTFLDEASHDDVGGGGGKGLKIAAALAAVMVAVGLLVGIVLVVGALVWKNQSGVPGTDTEVVVADGDGGETEVSEGPVGGTVLSKDTRTNVPMSKSTELKLDGDVVSVVVTGGVGFKAEWDGKAPFAVGPLPAGSYRAQVTPKEGSKIRNKTFTVEADKACSFTFDVAGQKWNGGCS